MDRLNAKPIVVTGARGFIGRRLVPALADAGWKVHAVDVQPVLSLDDPRICEHQADLSNQAGPFDPREPFALVHLAWDTSRDAATFSGQARQVSLLAGLLDRWTGHGLVQFIGMGSAEEYGGRGGVIKETDEAVLPLSPYGWAKRGGATLANSWSLRSGIPVLWFRPFIVYGEGQVGDMLIPYAVRQAAAGAPAEFTDGLQLRDFVHVDDVVRAILLSLRKQPAGFHAVNLGCGVPVRVGDALRTIAAEFQAERFFKLGARPRRPGEPDVQVADIRRASELLNWRPQVEWQDGIKAVCRQAKEI